ncbi:MAG TPA: hypothetical protein VN814_14935 [Caulobacteraceae bacterium]|nr:hypothetical protein [Caulobacteraceae bacterium]
MRAGATSIGLLLAVGLVTSACAAPKPGPELHCRHPLATVGAADGLPPTLLAQLHPWMALHGERWNDTDSIMPGDLTASFLWAAHWNGDWMVAFRSGGIACCHDRFALFVPGGPGLRMVLPPSGAPDDFGDVTCKGLDAALDAYGTGR